MRVQVKEFVLALCTASEKAAKIARRCRLDSDFSQRLVEEKKGDEKNERFQQDFKTLADVLIQEIVRRETEDRYPQLSGCVFGEETNMFTGVQGETVTLKVVDDEEETKRALVQILGDNSQDMAGKLIDDVYSQCDSQIDFSTIPDDLFMDNIGIWIDPIDGTNEYVKGNDSQPSSVTGILRNGLGCVTVLIGVFSQSTHEPLLGVVTQPFYNQEGSGYSSKTWWGVSIGSCKYNNLPLTHPCKPPTAVISSSEKEALRTTLAASYRLVEAAGAGYKLLCAALGLADACVVTMATTFKYDTCAPHALLLSHGGNLVELDGIVDEMKTSGSVDTEGYQVTYFAKDQKPHKNDHGIIGFVRESTLLDIIDLLV